MKVIVTKVYEVDYMLNVHVMFIFKIVMSELCTFTRLLYAESILQPYRLSLNSCNQYFSFSHSFLTKCELQEDEQRF